MTAVSTVDALRIFNLPDLTGGWMLLAFSGWMDGGAVSTGTVQRLLRDGQAVKVAEIDPDPFYIYNFPGSMEVSAIFRPPVRYESGLIESFEMPVNDFSADPQRRILFFLGKEPNLAWKAFGACLFEVARRAGVRRALFIGSFGGSVPHTREPRLYASVSHAHLKELLADAGVRFSDYEGPSSFTTYLMSRADAEGLEMISLAAEIPGYLQGTNPLSIEAVTRRLSKLLNLPVDLDALREASNEWESQVTAEVEKNPELAATVRKLEEAYDNELINGHVPPAADAGPDDEEGDEDDDDDDEGRFVIPQDEEDEEEDGEDDDDGDEDDDRPPGDVDGGPGHRL